MYYLHYFCQTDGGGGGLSYKWFLQTLEKRVYKIKALKFKENEHMVQLFMTTLPWNQASKTDLPLLVKTTQYTSGWYTVTGSSIGSPPSRRQGLRCDLCIFITPPFANGGFFNVCNFIKIAHKCLVLIRRPATKRRAMESYSTAVWRLNHPY